MNAPCNNGNRKGRYQHILNTHAQHTCSARGILFAVGLDQLLFFVCETSEGSDETVQCTVSSEPSLFAFETGISTQCDGAFIVFRRRMSNHCKKSQKARHDIIVAIFKGITVFFLLCLMNETCLVNMRNLRQGLSCHIYLGKCMYNACRRVHICDQRRGLVKAYVLNILVVLVECQE